MYAHQGPLIACSFLYRLLSSQHPEPGTDVLHEPDLIDMKRVAEILALVRRPAAISADILRGYGQLLYNFKFFLLRQRADMLCVIACAFLICHCSALHAVCIVGFCKN
jgi:hypothetical protein